MADPVDEADVVVAVKASWVNGTSDAELHCKPGCN